MSRVVASCIHSGLPGLTYSEAVRPSGSASVQLAIRLSLRQGVRPPRRASARASVRALERPNHDPTPITPPVCPRGPGGRQHGRPTDGQWTRGVSRADRPTGSGRAESTIMNSLLAAIPSYPTSRVVFGVGFWELKPPPICVACIVPLYLPTKLYEYGYASGGVGEGPIVGILHLG